MSVLRGHGHRERALVTKYPLLDPTEDRVCSNPSCKLAGIKQSPTNFSRGDRRRDGLASHCKDCDYQYRADHKEYYLEWNRCSYQNNRDQKLVQIARWYQQNKDKFNRARRELLNRDPLYKLATLLRSRINSALKAKSLRKTHKLKDYLGCTLSELKAYLEKQFQPGMSWKNNTREGWHIDHIVPLASATTSEEMYKLCHFSNLQPLWAKDNLSKSDKILGE